MDLHFTWDASKNRTNFRKHGVTFEEAVTVFLDENAVEFYDDGNSEWKIGFFSLGLATTRDCCSCATVFAVMTRSELYRREGLRAASRYTTKGHER